VTIPQQSNPNWKEEKEKREREERERELEEQKRRDAALKEMSKDAVDDLSKWKEEQERKEREFRQRHAEEERRKNEEIERMKREALEKKQREEEEFRKQQAAKQAAAPPTQQQSTNWCENCKREFSGILDIVIINGKKYCQACRNVATTSDPKAPKCGHCHLPLEMTWLNAAGRKYHPECLRCSLCGGDLSKGFRQAGRTFTCTDCAGFGLRTK